MLDDESGFERRKPVQRTADERAAIVAELRAWGDGCGGGASAWDSPFAIVGVAECSAAEEDGWF